MDVYFAIVSLWSFSLSVVSNSFRPHGLQHTRLPSPSPSPRICSNSCPTMSSSVSLFSSYPQSFPAWGSFPVSRLFASGGQSIGASASVLPVNIQGWFLQGDWLDLLAVQGTLKTCCSRDCSRVFSSTTVGKYQFFGTQPSLWSSSHIWTWLLEKPLLCCETIFLSEFCISVYFQSPKIKGREETFKKYFSISTTLWCLHLSGTLCEDKEKGWTKAETEHNQSGRTGKAREGGSVAVRGRAPIPGMKTSVWLIPEAPK